MKEEKIEKAFREAWDKSGLPEYFQRMDELAKMGFHFEDNVGGDMNYFQSEALNDFIKERYTEGTSILDIDIKDIESEKEKIFNRAKEIESEYRE